MNVYHCKWYWNCTIDYIIDHSYNCQDSKWRGEQKMPIQQQEEFLR